MEFSRKLFSTLTTGQSTDSGRTAVMKDNMLRLIYGEMMGQDVQFGAIYALKLAQSGQTVAEKRAGMLIQDLTSSNYHHVVVALVTLCNMTLPDVIPSMVSHVLAALSHTHESVRKRALIALKNFFTLGADLVLPYLDQIKDSLYDPEPSVMSAALGFFAIAVKDHAREMKELVPALIKILQQVVDGKLPKGYLYHGMAAPWIQIRCLMIMAQLGHDDLSASTAMTPVVLRAFQKASQGVDAAFGVLFEVLRTLNNFHPSIILELCQSKDATRNPLLTIPRFATSTNPNLKYLGISMLCQVNPDAWSDTWWTEDLLQAVVEALESRDAAIQKRALDLLYRMLTMENAQNIVERLVFAYFQEQDNIQGPGGVGPQQQQQQQVLSSFPSRKEKILGQILDAAERFGHQMTSPSQPALALAYFVFWALGEYGDKITAAVEGGDEFDLSAVLEVLARCLLVIQDPLIQSFVLSALTKLSIKALPNPTPASITTVVRQLCQNRTTPATASLLTVIEVQQRAAEFLMITDLADS
ncbi:AP-4 complex subunit epsilon-1 [Mortierella sp. AD032]|nr:AP-4 complex subunit epsilon-1 [Mortierella sp. AD032]